jgi:uncharacterized membrane protein HdeD (DUF308 family)
MANSLTADVHRSMNWSIVLSVLMIATGVLAIAIPLTAGVAVTAIVGWLLIFSGVLHFVFGWRAGRASSVVWEILIGAAYAVIGFFVLTNPLVGLASLTLALAAYLLVKGVLELVLSLRLRHAPGSGWLLFGGIITLVLAVMIWASWPSSALWVIGTLVGISMLFSGITRLMLTLAVRRVLG